MTDTTARGAGPAERAQHAGGDGPAPSRRRRMSAQRKQSSVLRLLRGEDLELVSRELGVTAAELSAWREAFLTAGEAAPLPPGTTPSPGSLAAAPTSRARRSRAG